MGKTEQNQKQELAKLYYLQGLSQKEIAQKVDVSTVTMTKWVQKYGWDTIRAATTITRKELIVKMLKKLNDKLEEKTISADEMVKVAAAIEKIDKQTNVVTVIDVFSSYNKWLIARMKLDPQLTPDLIKTMNRYQDLFISDKLSSTTIEFKD
jgi:uncharacterized protein YjcR